MAGDYGILSFYSYGIRGRKEGDTEHLAWYSADVLTRVANMAGFEHTAIAYVGNDPVDRPMRWLKELPEKWFPKTQPILGMVAVK